MRLVKGNTRPQGHRLFIVHCPKCLVPVKAPREGLAIRALGAHIVRVHPPTQTQGAA